MNHPEAAALHGQWKKIFPFFFRLRMTRHRDASGRQMLSKTFPTGCTQPQ